MNRQIQIFLSYSGTKGPAQHVIVVRQVANLCKEVLEHRKWTCLDPMSSRDSENIHQRIVRELNSADGLIAEVTLCPPNIGLEIGYQIALGRPVVCLIRDDIKELMEQDEVFRKHIELTGATHERPLPTDLGDLQFIDYPSDLTSESLSGNFMWDCIVFAA